MAKMVLGKSRINITNLFFALILQYALSTNFPARHSADASNLHAQANHELNNESPSSILSRQQRSLVVTDLGYGSRQRTGANAANVALMNRILADVGKRSEPEAQTLELLLEQDNSEDYDSQLLADKQSNGFSKRGNFGILKPHIFEDKYGVYGKGVQPVKNSITDLGYASRNDAARQVANDLVAYKSLFSKYGVGRRRRASM